MRRVTLSVLALGLLLLPTTIQAAVEYDYDSEADFSAFKTFAWKRGQNRPRPTAANPLMDKRIQSAIEGELEAKGYALATAGEKPDFLISYHAVVTSQVRVREYGRPRWGRRIDVDTYRQGNLILDIIDADRRELVWRGWTTNTVGDPKKSQKKIDKAVAKLLKKFPPPK